MRAVPVSFRKAAALAVLILPLGGCEALPLAMLGIGANAGISHQMGGPAYRTFTAPLTKVRAATMLALQRMGIRVDSVEKTGYGEILYARAADRRIEVEIESLTQATTRIRAVARMDLLMVDPATAAEIITQTQKAMGV